MNRGAFDIQSCAQTIRSAGSPRVPSSLPRGRTKVHTSVASVGCLAAGDQTVGAALERLVDQREPHRHAGVVGLALAPGFREVALQQLDVGDLVDVVAGLVLLEVLGEVRHHFGRGQRVQLGDVLVRPCGLDVAEQALEGLVVVRLDLQRRAARAQAEAGSGSQAVQAVPPGPTSGSGRRAGIGRRGGVDGAATTTSPAGPR